MTALSIRKSILSFLLVRESESKLVSRLFIFEFFQGAAIAIVFTTAITLFLQQLPTTDLPIVFFLSAFALWIAAYLYNRLEHKFSSTKMVLIVLLFNTACVLIFLFFISYEKNSWFLFAFLGAFNILYLLNNLEFWGLASLLFDVRQSKRLFSVVSASDLPAKLFGYLLTIFLVPHVGTENLLWVALVCMLVSLILYKPLIELNEIKNLGEISHSHEAPGIKAIQAALTGNKLIRILALVSFFSLCCLLVVNLVFYGYIKHQFKSDKSMAGFFAIFLGGVRLITLLIKVGITNRLVDKMGLRRSLLVTPFILLVICLICLFFSLRTSSFKTTFYLFGVLALATDVLKMAVQTPVLLAAMQPLPTHQRLRGHTLLKGLMDPFAFFAMGGLLWMLTSFDKEMHLGILGLILLFLIVCWIIFASQVDKYYSAALTVAIRDRSLNGKFISITDNDSLQLLYDKLENGTETEVIAVLNLLASQSGNLTGFFSRGLNHSSQAVKGYVLRLIRDKKAIGLLPDLRLMATDPANTELVPEILETIASFNQDEDFSGFVNHDDPMIALAAVRAQLLDRTNFHEAAEAKLREWFVAKEQDKKIAALKVAGEINNGRYIPEIERLMQDDDMDVRKNAMKAAGLNGHAPTVKELFDRFINTINDSTALAALIDCNEHVFPAVKDYLQKKKCEGGKCRKLLVLLGKSGHAAAKQVLDECLREFPGKAKIILPVIRLRHNSAGANEAQYQKMISSHLTAAIHLVYAVNFLLQQHPREELVIEALRTELNDIKENCLDLFSLLYDEEKIRRVKAGFEINSRESIANALELIFVSVPKQFGLPFIQVFENSDIRDKYIQLQKTVQESSLSKDAVIKNILFDVDYNYNSWTKSCVLYILKDKKLPFGKEFIQPFTFADSSLLKETAQMIIAKN
ncbi:MAG: cyclic nucleotide-binding protein [Chitinophagaceae bacterium]|nr:cyclic nucleotide-binding protein [Chitinophagaceae bacterium]